MSAWLLISAAPGIASAQSGQWQVGTAPSFSSGTYGTDARTEVLHTPMTVRRLFEDGDAAVVLPITCVRGSGTIAVVSGSPVPVRTERPGGGAAPSTRSEAAGNSGRGGTSSRGSADAAAPASAARAPATSCGMGDIVVRGRYFLVDERGWRPTIAVRAHLKTPTGSADRGLGTGRPDEGIGVEVSRTLGGLTVMVDGGYTVIGQPAGVDYRNVWWYDVGVGHDLADGRITLSAFLDQYTAIVAGLPGAREVLATLSLNGAQRWRVQVTGLVGLSDGAPDHGLAIGASRRF
jgi:hypothetical protein